MSFRCLIENLLQLRLTGLILTYIEIPLTYTRLKSIRLSPLAVSVDIILRRYHIQQYKLSVTLGVIYPNNSNYINVL